MSDDIEAVTARIDYLEPSSRINRRFWSKGVEFNTGTYAAHEVKVGDARQAPWPLSLDVNGFRLERHDSGVADFHDKARVDALYADEMVAVMRELPELEGADAILPMGATLRSAAARAGDKVQPPATDAHVDFVTPSAERFARAMYERARPDGPGYSRFAIHGQWRAFSPPPQDWPLALCDARSVDPEEGSPNVLVIVDALPEGDGVYAEIPGEADLPAAWVFSQSPAHRWWYFPDLTRDELIVFKFYDSDHARPWRTPHTAFHDLSRPDAHNRESIEFRTVAYWR